MMEATRSMVLAYEDLNEPDAARFAFQPRAERTHELEPRCLTAAWHLPYSPQDRPEAPWELVEQ